jgi:hypothetical protein
MASIENGSFGGDYFAAAQFINLMAISIKRERTLIKR